MIELDAANGGAKDVLQGQEREGSGEVGEGAIGVEEDEERVDQGGQKDLVHVLLLLAQLLREKPCDDEGTRVGGCKLVFSHFGLYITTCLLTHVGIFRSDRLHGF